MRMEPKKSRSASSDSWFTTLAFSLALLLVKLGQIEWEMGLKGDMWYFGLIKYS